MKWLQALVGRLCSCALARLRSVALRPRSTTSARRDQPPKAGSQSPRLKGPGKCAPSGPWLRLNAKRRQAQGGRASLRLLLALVVAAICLPTLPGCSGGWFSKREPQPPATVECPLVKCLDRLMQSESILPDTPTMPRTCADVTVVAADALGALIVSETRRNELVQCIRDFNEAVSKGNAG